MEEDSIEECCNQGIFFLNLVVAIRIVVLEKVPNASADQDRLWLHS